MRRALLSMLVLAAGCAADEGANPNLDGCESDADCSAGVCYRGFCVTGRMDAGGPVCPPDLQCYEGPADTESRGLCAPGCTFEGPGGETICANQVLPAEEVCNTVDDDCDGTIDEGFESLDTVEMCGSCTTRCASGELCCATRAGDGHECANVTSSADHCGMCGDPCGAGEACCGSECFDVQSDPMHCGTCGNQCAPGLLCCDGACVNPNTSAANCGGCGPMSACEDGEECCAGACMDECAPCEPPCDQTCCGGGPNCFDIGTDPLNCGRCGRACAVDERCCAGGCVSLDDACADCGDDCGDTGQCCGSECVPTTSLAHCGGCDMACEPGESCCDSGCTDTLLDNSNCGGCGNTCGTDICSGGHCCPPGTTWCGDAAGCQNLAGNNSHCGRCGNACPALTACRRPTIGPGGYDCRTL